MKKHLLFLPCLLLLIACSGSKYKAGDIYSVDTGEEKFRVVKVLVVEPPYIHVRMYQDRFDKRPGKIDTKELTIGDQASEGGPGVGSIPLPLDNFKEWEPELITNEKVTDEELQGYKVWKENSK
ncbi:MAG TPA: hypothetical protein VI112_03645 [Bacteroidia bacterium]